MDWLNGLNRVMRYIEENLTEQLDKEILARMVGCSIYEFSRVFSFLTGMSVSEYIRCRRLSQAVFDIQGGKEKIVDIALKYGYESPAAFTRAFKHWVNEYWSFTDNRWVLVDVDGYYEYERRFGYSQFDLPRRKFLTASEVWLRLRDNTLTPKIVLYSTEQDILEGVCGYLFMDFHALMNNEIFYSHQPKYLHHRFQLLSREELAELDRLALLMQSPDTVIHQKQELMKSHEHFFILTNSNMNELSDYYEINNP